jgi:signal transduction histidine kinase
MIEHLSDSSEILEASFLEGVLKQAAASLHAKGGAFYFFDPLRKKATLSAAHELKEIAWDPAIAVRVAESKRVVIEKAAKDYILLAAPLTWREAVRAIMLVCDTNIDREFGLEDMILLQSLADLTASVASQTEHLARMKSQFRALHMIDVALSSSLQLDRVLNLILEKAVELVGAEHGSFRKLVPETGELVLQSHFGAGWTPEAIAFSPKTGQGIARWVVENKQPYLSSDVRKDPRNVVLFEDMRSTVAVPLQFSQKGQKGKDKIIGVLLLESSQLAAFDRQDVEVLESLAQEAVIALQNATQHQELQLMHKRLQTESEKRVAAEKWAIMGQAATALVHRINNLMGIVPVSANEIQKSLHKLTVPEHDRKWIKDNLDRIERNSRFILKISNALFKPFKEAGPVLRLDVNRVLNEALKYADLPHTIQVERHYGEDLPLVECNSLLVDIFLEIISNAKHAMQAQSIQRLGLNTHLEKDERGQWVVVDISDTGKGISEEKKPHLWNIFQHSDEGLGFGLWWLRTFIERQGGTIDCASEEGQGAVFSVRLPAYQEKKNVRM